MYDHEFRKTLVKIFFKLAKKNPKQMNIINKKIKEVIVNPHRYKNLRKPLQKLKRIHIDNSFVLTYSINESKKLVIFEDYDHHDNIYMAKNF